MRGVTFRLRYGEVCSVLGNNGAGKTTLLKCVLNLLRPAGGAVLVEETPIRSWRHEERAKKMGYVPQRQEGYHRLTVFEAVLLGRRPYVGWSAGAETWRWGGRFWTASACPPSLSDTPTS